MFEKVSQVAAQVATHLSRREFLGKAGRSALVVAGLLGGFLAALGEAQGFGREACCYSHASGSICKVSRHNRCPSGTIPAGCPQGPVPQC